MDRFRSRDWGAPAAYSLIMTMEPSIPVLEGDAAAAAAHRGGHVQIIAAAGSGKTEVVSQRVAALLADGEPPQSIVAFTFTDKAATELKERIRERVTARLGESAADQLGRLYVGTIHGYCFRLLQTHVPRFEVYTPLDPNQLTNLLYREANRLGLKSLDPGGKVFKGIDQVALLTLLQGAGSGPKVRATLGQRVWLRSPCRLDGSLGMAARCPPMAGPLIESCDTDRWVRTCRRGHRQGADPPDRKDTSWRHSGPE